MKQIVRFEVSAQSLIDLFSERKSDVAEIVGYNSLNEGVDDLFSSLGMQLASELFGADFKQIDDDTFEITVRASEKGEFDRHFRVKKGGAWSEKTTIRNNRPAFGDKWVTLFLHLSPHLTYIDIWRWFVCDATTTLVVDNNTAAA